MKKKTVDRERQTERDTERHRERQAERQTERQTERDRESGVEVFDWLLFDQLISKLHVSDFDVASLKLICTYLRAKINDKYNLKKSY